MSSISNICYQYCNRYVCEDIPHEHEVNTCIPYSHGLFGYWSLTGGTCILGSVDYSLSNCRSAFSGIPANFTSINPSSCRSDISEINFFGFVATPSCSYSGTPYTNEQCIAAQACINHCGVDFVQQCIPDNWSFTTAYGNVSYHPTGSVLCSERPDATSVSPFVFHNNVSESGLNTCINSYFNNCSSTYINRFNFSNICIKELHRCGILQNPDRAGDIY